MSTIHDDNDDDHYYHQYYHKSPQAKDEGGGGMWISAETAHQINKLKEAMAQAQLQDLRDNNNRDIRSTSRATTRPQPQSIRPIPPLPRSGYNNNHSHSRNLNHPLLQKINEEWDSNLQENQVLKEQLYKNQLDAEVNQKEKQLLQNQLELSLQNNQLALQNQSQLQKAKLESQQLLEEKNILLNKIQQATRDMRKELGGLVQQDGNNTTTTTTQTFTPKPMHHHASTRSPPPAPAPPSFPPPPPSPPGWSFSRPRNVPPPPPPPPTTNSHYKQQQQHHQQQQKQHQYDEIIQQLKTNITTLQKEMNSLQNQRQLLDKNLVASKQRIITQTHLLNAAEESFRNAFHNEIGTLRKQLQQLQQQQIDPHTTATTTTSPSVPPPLTTGTTNKQHNYDDIISQIRADIATLHQEILQQQKQRKFLDTNLVDTKQKIQTQKHLLDALVDSFQNSFHTEVNSLRKQLELLQQQAGVVEEKPTTNNNSNANRHHPNSYNGGGGGGGGGGGVTRGPSTTNIPPQQQQRPQFLVMPIVPYSAIQKQQQQQNQQHPRQRLQQQQQRQLPQQQQRQPRHSPPLPAAPPGTGTTTATSQVANPRTTTTMMAMVAPPVAVGPSNENQFFKTTATTMQQPNTDHPPRVQPQQLVPFNNNNTLAGDQSVWAKSSHPTWNYNLLYEYVEKNGRQTTTDFWKQKQQHQLMPAGQPVQQRQQGHRPRRPSLQSTGETIEEVWNDYQDQQHHHPKAPTTASGTSRDLPRSSGYYAKGILNPSTGTGGAVASMAFPQHDMAIRAAATVGATFMIPQQQQQQQPHLVVQQQRFPLQPPPPPAAAAAAAASPLKMKDYLQGGDKNTRMKYRNRSPILVPQPQEHRRQNMTENPSTTTDNTNTNMAWKTTPPTQPSSSLQYPGQPTSPPPNKMHGRQKTPIISPSTTTKPAALSSSSSWATIATATPPSVWGPKHKHNYSYHTNHVE